MKYFIALLLLLISSITIFSQTATVLNPEVDKRVELLSIAFRLAGAEEYESTKFELYTDTIEKHFNQYKNHELIAFIKKIREEHNIGYDAVMYMAIHISQPPELEPLVTFTENVPDKRWNERTSYKFLELLRQFYHDTQFETFFTNSVSIYEESIKKFMPIYNMLDIDWYEKFYGEKPNGTFHILNGLGNGVGNYGGKVRYPNNTTDRFSIMGTWSVDSIGLPKYNIREYFPVLVHEINHSFINHLTENSKTQLESSGQVIFSEVSEAMNAQAYGNWMTMINESIVRAAVLKYIQDHDFGEQQFTNILMNEINGGFIWIESLVEVLNSYDNNRDKFPTLKSFMPELEKFFSETAINIKTIKSSIENKRPKVVSIQPFDNNRKNVNPGVEEISVTFDRPLIGRGYSYIKGEKGEEAMPEITKVLYSEDKKTVLFKVKLVPNKEYQFQLMGAAFKTKDGYGMDNYEINFSTQQ